MLWLRAGASAPALASPSILGCSQVVRHGTLTPAFAGSSPAIPATSAQAAYRSLPHKRESSLTSLRLLSPDRLEGGDPGTPFRAKSVTSSPQAALRGGDPGLFEAQSPVPHTSWICLARVRNQMKFDPVAQLVEQRPFKAKVRGSSPRWVTKSRNLYFQWFRDFPYSRNDSINFTCFIFK